MHTSVPNAPWKVPPEELTVIPSGEYKARITEILEPVAMYSRPLFLVRFVLDLNGRKCYSFYGGYLDTTIMIYRNRHLWLNKEVAIKVSERKTDNQIYNSIEILWSNPDKGRNDVQS